jgi:hypothetical protein
VLFVATKKCRQKKIPPFSFAAVFVSGIRDNIPSATHNGAFLFWIPVGAGYSEKPDNRAAAGEPEHHTQHPRRGDIRPTREGDLGRGYQVLPPIHPEGLPCFAAPKVCRFGEKIIVLQPTR